MIWNIPIINKLSQQTSSAMNLLYCISWAANRWCGAFGAVRWRSRGPSESHWVIRGLMLRPRLLQRKCEAVSAPVALQTDGRIWVSLLLCVSLPLWSDSIHESWRPRRWTSSAWPFTYWRRKAGDKYSVSEYSVCFCATNKSVVLLAPFNIINPGRNPFCRMKQIN